MTTTHTTHNRPAPEQNDAHPIVIKILKTRGYSPDQIKDFFSWDLKQLPNLLELKDLKVSSERILDAISAGEKIGVYGDYDVDGTTSCALLYHFFKTLGVEVELFQPSRFVEGYGIHPSGIDNAIKKGVKVLLTVDCGITNCEAADYAKEKGVDLIITDHHKDAAKEMPNAYAIINPNRRDENLDSELCKLAGVGVAFALSWQIKNDRDAIGNKTPSIYHLLPYVAIGTICDMAVLSPMNLKLVRHGLKQMLTTNYLGLKSFLSLEERKLTRIPSEKLSFGIGPLINSKGRLDHPEKALQLLITNDPDITHECSNHLEISNNERKFIQGQVFKGAREKVIKEINNNNPSVAIVYDPEWHEGVIGIVASKVVETFHMPAIIFTNSSEEGIIKASARTVAELDLFECLNAHRDLFIKFGGHKAAAGLSMKKENLPELKKRMNEYISKIPAIIRTPQKHYDMEITAADISPKLVKNLEMLEPFGNGNSKPIFKIYDLKLDSYKVLKEVHVSWSFSIIKEGFFKKIKGITFNYLTKWNEPHPEEIFRLQNTKDDKLAVLAELAINRFNGNEYVQIMVKNFEYH